jgi:hypothetical protein
MTIAFDQEAFALRMNLVEIVSGGIPTIARLAGELHDLETPSFVTETRIRGRATFASDNRRPWYLFCFGEENRKDVCALDGDSARKKSL